MKQYTHDYTLPSLAESLLLTAEAAIRFEDYGRASKAINDARHTLQQYLSQDNMVEDPDVADGWVRMSDVNRYKYRPPVDPATTVAGQKVEKHGQIDSRYLKQQTEGADPTNPLYGKIAVESGTYEQIGMTRDQVAEAIQKLGAKLNRDVSKKMNVFVTGNKPGPSKMEKVQSWRAEGIDIRIISQIELKEIIDKYLPNL